jgi:hypothetical protein
MSDDRAEGRTEPGSTREPADPSTAARRARRRARVFGDVLPDSTRDDRPPGGPEEQATDAGDDWLRANVPPHHGG